MIYPSFGLYIETQYIFTHFKINLVAYSDLDQAFYLSSCIFHIVLLAYIYAIGQCGILTAINTSVLFFMYKRSLISRFQRISILIIIG